MISPFNAVRSPAGDIVVFYVGAEPRLTAEQALAFADQLRALAAEPQPAPAGLTGRRHAAA
ncbi:hypothetical protein E1295_10760 [Nonomuraea mesophila]|uniref:Uncharacterized protein n=1 Tax=Nonomuraea mesophila TaxID=2530382 RepID=A0A4R5FTZ4_9ACTN|nr:hypothetical protein [Nonomuraea mesophila]TDE56421.1 hypothetical protein E1295_10760 [Nonomuraea mesophila]